jgi:3-oxoacyl-[acyl-carrier-protein] synthase-3
VTTSFIRAVAHALPTHRVTNEMLAERFGEKPMRSIAKMSGIQERRVVAPGQCASDLGLAAAERLLDHLGVERDSIDLLIFCSQTPDYRMPATASVLHGKLGLAERCCAFDINQACASYVHSLQVAHSMLVAGTAKRALLINADALSQLVHPQDRSMLPLTGDAGVATLLEPSATDAGFERFRICNDGKLFDKLYIPAGGCRLPASPETAKPITDADGITRSLDSVYMDGTAVFHFAAHKVSGFLRDCLADWSLGIDAIDTVLLHQANKTMVDLIYRAIGAGPEKQFANIRQVGNAACASLPALLAEAWREGAIKPGSRTLMCGFGGGLSWGAAVIRWPDDADAAVPGIIDVAVP